MPQTRHLLRITAVLFLGLVVITSVQVPRFISGNIDKVSAQLILAVPQDVYPVVTTVQDAADNEGSALIEKVRQRLESETATVVVPEVIENATESEIATATNTSQMNEVSSPEILPESIDDTPTDVATSAPSFEETSLPPIEISF